MKNILITGANKGIGLAAVEACLRADQETHILLCSRDKQRGELAGAALAELEPSWRERITVLPLDVASDASVAEARAALLSHDPNFSLYGIVNNAGVGLGTVAELVNVNLHGIRRVCETFADRVAGNGRIVNVTSASGPNYVATCTAQRQGFFTDPEVNWSSIEAFIERCGELAPEQLDELGLGSDSPYGFSKACANSYTMWLARLYPALNVNACTPGFIETDLGKEFLGSRTPQEAGMKSAADGARVIVKLLFGEPGGTGHYYGSDGLRSPMHRYRAPGSAEFTDRD